MYPRTTTFTWNTVQTSDKYRVEIQYQSPDGSWSDWDNVLVSGTSYTKNFVGDQHGRWRVTAIDTTGARPSSEPSAWWGFNYIFVRQLTAPVLVSPADGSEFSIYPRTTNYAWNPVAGANRYFIEIQYLSGSWSNWRTATVTGTSHTDNFVGAQPGRWRVTAQDSSGIHTASTPSAWRGFSYTV